MQKRNNLPKDWSEVTLNEYKKLVNVLPAITEDLDLNAQVAIALKVFDTLGFGHYNQLDIDELMLKLDEVSFVFTQPNVNDIKSVVIDGKKYGFNSRHFWSVVEFVQLSEFMQDKNAEDVIENLEYLIAIFLRPIDEKVEKVSTPIKFKLFGKERILNKKKYQVVETVQQLNVNDIEERAKLFAEKLPASIAYSLYVFFYLLTTELSIATLQSSVEEAVTELKQI